MPKLTAIQRAQAAVDHAQAKVDKAIRSAQELAQKIANREQAKAKSTAIRAGQLVLNYKILRIAGPRQHNNLPWEAECIECGEHFVRADQQWRKCKTPCEHPAQHQRLREEQLGRNAEERYFASLFCRCGNPRIPGSNYYPYCSRECRNTYTYTPVEEQEYFCKVCSTPFTGVGNRSYCSTACADKARDAAKVLYNKAHPQQQGHRKRARYFGGAIEPINWKKVMERDGWICGICHLPVSEARWPADLSPTLGHIIPLGRGGGHLYSNVRCEHWICNSIKSDRLDDEMEVNAVTIASCA